jgi:starch-binding outer membrane protein, SusD/RagB family
MKNITKYILILLIFSTIACDNILEPVPNDRLDSESFFKNREDAEAGLIAAYDIVFRDIAPTIVQFSDRASRSVVQVGDNTGNVIQYRPNLETGRDGGSGTFWTNSYRALARINVLIERVSLLDESLFTEVGVPNTRNRKQEILGEAYFLRAYVYYNLVQHFGGVPLVLTFPTSANPADNYIARASEADVWTQIKKDLNLAVEGLPLNHNLIRANQNATLQRTQSKSRATKGMANLMLARVALREQRWDDAIKFSDAILNSKEYSLTATWTSIFQNTTGQLATESILEINNVKDGFNNTGGFTFGYEFFTNGRFAFAPEANYFFEGSYRNPRDVRQAFCANVNGADTTRISPFKYYNRDGPYASNDWFNFVLGRLSEVYLIKAEALNEKSFPNNEALTLINAIRARARDNAYLVSTVGGRPLYATGIRSISFTNSATTIEVKDQVAFRQFIRDERKRELMLEGHEWYDILRYDLYDKGDRAVKSTFLAQGITGSNNGKVLLPIPIAEIRRNPLLTQNAGYQ